MEESSRCNEVVGVEGISNIIDTNNKLMEKKYLLNKLLEDSSIQSTLMKVKGDEALTGEDNYFLTILEKYKFNLDNSIQHFINQNQIEVLGEWFYDWRPGDGDWEFRRYEDPIGIHQRCRTGS